MPLTKHQKNRIEEHWLFALWVLLFTLLPYIAFGSHVSAADGFPRVAAIIILVGAAYVVYRHDPNYDVLKWVCVIASAGFAIWIMMQASDFKING